MNIRIAGIPPGDVALKDALVTGNLLDGASGPEGSFALPVLAPGPGGFAITGRRWDLGLTGTLAVAVPSAGNALRLTTVPFQIQGVLPLEGAVVGLDAVFSVLATAPMDPGSLLGVKFRQGGQELPLRRQLSLDGRTLLLTPEGGLAVGTAYTLGVEGLRSLAGETAPAIQRNFSTAPPAPPPSEVDFSRILLGYPDANFDVPMTLPAGAVPAGASLLVEGLGMGFTFTGQMPSAGDLTLTLRAALGERLCITVQFAGRTTVGYASRYAAGDGRVTVGVDGGRVEASDGSGAAVVIPPGALEAPVEFRVQVLTEKPSDLDPALAAALDQMAGVFAGRIQLLGPTGTTLLKRPILPDFAQADEFGSRPRLGPNAKFGVAAGRVVGPQEGNRHRPVSLFVRKGNVVLELDFVIPLRLGRKLDPGD